MEELILLVKVGNSLGDGKSCYEATRGTWRVSKEKIKSEQIKYVAGIDNKGNNEAVCVFIPQRWHTVEVGPEKQIGKKYFEGIEAPNEILIKLNKGEKLSSKFGRGQSIAYIPISEIEEI